MISGANRGFGRALAQHLLDEGYNVSCGVRRPEEAAAALAGPTERLIVHRYDATDGASGDGWLAATVERFGGLDVLVNNAGIVDPAPLDELSEASLDRMWLVNVKAPFRLIQAALPHLRAGGAGRVVNLSSLSGLRVKGVFAPGYAMSKHAVTALSEATKNAAWDDGVRITTVHPGFINTDMTAEFDFPAEDMIQPDDLAEVLAIVLRLPNTAQVARLTVACELEPGF
jgi:NAD(P)-dependent dehydrogenase (short-subunit alcohol dehydrogenase family)